MNPFFLSASHNTPLIFLSPEENIFKITGKSAPEDVRSLYYPVIDWFDLFVKEAKNSGRDKRSVPFTLVISLSYFNSSSAKFIFDILKKLKELADSGTPVFIEWHYEKGDVDVKEAGEDMEELSELPFRYFVEEIAK